MLVVTLHAITTGTTQVELLHSLHPYIWMFNIAVRFESYNMQIPLCRQCAPLTITIPKLYIIYMYIAYKSAMFGAYTALLTRALFEPAKNKFRSYSLPFQHSTNTKKIKTLPNGMLDFLGLWLLAAKASCCARVYQLLITKEFRTIKTKMKSWW